MSTKYLIFIGDQYYPCGGWGDYLTYRDSLKEAIIAAQTYAMDGSYTFPWAHVVNLATMEIEWKYVPKE